MIGELVRSEIAQSELSNSTITHLHFDKRTTRITKSGSLCRFVALGNL
jgi:hypothetical protein